MPTLTALIDLKLLASALPKKVAVNGIHAVLHNTLKGAGFNFVAKNDKGQAKYVHQQTGDKAHTNVRGDWHLRPGTSYTSKRGNGNDSLKAALKARKYKTGDKPKDNISETLKLK